MSFMLVAPRCVLVGGGAVAEIAALLQRFALSRPLIVTDPFMLSSGLLRRLTGPLEAADIAFDVFSATIPEPTEAVVRAGVLRMNQLPYDCLIGFGGGSPIDTAKAMTILAARRHAADGGITRCRLQPPMRAALPLIAIPTTAGTGSEATRFTIITDVDPGRERC